MKKVAVAGLLISVGAAGALGIHAQLESRPPADPDPGAPMTLDDARAISEAPAEACPALIVGLDVYEQTGAAEFAALARDRIAELGCPDG